MARKQRQETEIEPVELPEHSDESETHIVNPIRDKVRPVPDSDWSTLVTEMHDYISTHHDLINMSLQKNAELAAKSGPSKKPSRSVAQARPSVILRDDIPAQPTPSQETVKKEVFPRNRRIKRDR